MALSVSTSNGGGGLSNLLRQTRPAKSTDDASLAAANDQPANLSSRQFGRSAIDSTGSGTAQITAALTVYLSKLDGSEEGGAYAKPQGKTAGLPAAGSRDGDAPRSGASDLLRVLDAYGAPRLARRMTA